MSHWTSWVQLGSWLAGIIGALFAVAMVAQASNTSRMKAALEIAEPFVRALAHSLDKPDMLAAYESESTAAKDILRKKRRRKLVGAGVVAGLALAQVGFVLLYSGLPSPEGIRFSDGDAAQHECTRRGLGWVANTTCTYHWFLDSSGQEIQAQGTVQGPAREADLDIVVHGCSGSAQVRWELLADGESLGNGMADSERQEEQDLTVSGDTSALTIRAERIDDASCSAELVVKAVVWH